MYNAHASNPRACGNPTELPHSIIYCLQIPQPNNPVIQLCSLRFMTNFQLSLKQKLHLYNQIFSKVLSALKMTRPKENILLQATCNPKSRKEQKEAKHLEEQGV